MGAAGLLLVAVPVAFGLLFDLGVPPLVTLFGRDARGLVATAAAVAASVRLDRRTAGAPRPRRQLVVAGNVALVALCLIAGLGLRAKIAYNEGVVYAADTSYLQGPDNGAGPQPHGLSGRLWQGGAVPTPPPHFP